MEEDIKVLEELKNRRIYFNSSYFASEYVELDKEEKQAIENLIKEYKELEDTINDLVQVKQDVGSISYTMPSKLAKASIEVLVNSGLRIENEKLKNENHDLKEQLENYIPKSKVKEARNKFDKMVQKMYARKKEITDHDVFILFDELLEGDK